MLLKKLDKRKEGQSILEVIVAMAIFALISVTLISLALGSFVGLEQGGEQTEAEYLAQEGVEAVKAIYGRAWNELEYNTSAVSLDTNGWFFDGEGTTENIGQFTRTILFSSVCRDTQNDVVNCPGAYTDVHSKRVTIVVIWSTRDGISNTVKRELYITNWDSDFFVQTDWSSGSGQSKLVDYSSYDSDNGKIEVGTVGQIQLKGVALGGFETNGSVVSSAFDMGDNSPVQIIEWSEIIPLCSPFCSIELEISTAPDVSGSPGVWTDWYGESGVGTTFTNFNGTVISNNLNGNRWLRYRATLSGDGNSTPVLNEVRVNYK